MEKLQPHSIDQTIVKSCSWSTIKPSKLIKSFPFKQIYKKKLVLSIHQMPKKTENLSSALVEQTFSIEINLNYQIKFIAKAFFYLKL